MIAGPAFADSPAQRSAQSDCSREAARRGYTVISTRNYQQHKDGWSVDLQARDPAGRVSWGSCFVETKTGDVSLFGFGWGGGGGSGGSDGNRFEFNCASVEGKYRECQLPVDGRALLVKQKSDAPCIQGRSWGQRGDRVWVDKGCRAKFEVSVGSGTGQQVECWSEQQRYRECRIPSGYVAKLVRDDSGGKCRNASAWGTRDGLIWVNYGCKGRFELSRRGGGGGGGGGSGGSGPAQAERACLGEAQRQGLRVYQQSAPRPVSGGYGMQMQVRRGNGGPLMAAYCRYWTNPGRAEISY
jgi:hypothetical protein